MVLANPSHKRHAHLDMRAEETRAVLAKVSQDLRTK